MAMSTWGHFVYPPASNGALKKALAKIKTEIDANFNDIQRKLIESQQAEPFVPFEPSYHAISQRVISEPQVKIGMSYESVAQVVDDGERWLINGGAGFNPALIPSGIGSYHEPDSYQGTGLGIKIGMTYDEVNMIFGIGFNRLSIINAKEEITIKLGHGIPTMTFKNGILIRIQE